MFSGLFGIVERTPWPAEARKLSSSTPFTPWYTWNLLNLGHEGVLECALVEISVVSETSGRGLRGKPIRKNPVVFAVIV